MIIVFSKIIGKSFSAVTIYPFIFLKNPDLKKDIVLLNHENIHLAQQKELLWLPFFVWYLVEYIIKWLYYRQAYLAYKNISFEREAYYFEHHVGYLHNRRPFSFIKFI